MFFNDVFQVLRSENIEFVVAPYEADAQLAYLSSLEVEKGGIVAVITEDSDLIAYGCKAVRIFFFFFPDLCKWMVTLHISSFICYITCC